MLTSCKLYGSGPATPLHRYRERHLLRVKRRLSLDYHVAYSNLLVVLRLHEYWLHTFNHVMVTYPTLFLDDRYDKRY